MVYDGDEATGIRVWESGHAGYMVSNLINLPANGNGREWIDAAGTVNPDAVVVSFGANEYANAVAHATFRANLETLAGNLEAEITNDFDLVLCIPPERTDIAEPALAWSGYRTAIQDAANATGARVLDVDTAFNLHADPASLMGPDGIHPTDAGYDYWAQLAVELFPLSSYVATTAYQSISIDLAIGIG